MKEVEFHRKVKAGREQEAANAALDAKIHEANERLYKALIELENMQQNPKASTFKERPAAHQEPPPKRSSSAFKEPKLSLSEKHKLTLQADSPGPIEHSSKSLGRA